MTDLARLRHPAASGTLREFVQQVRQGQFLAGSVLAVDQCRTAPLPPPTASPTFEAAAWFARARLRRASRSRFGMGDSAQLAALVIYRHQCRLPERPPQALKSLTRHQDSRVPRFLCCRYWLACAFTAVMHTTRCTFCRVPMARCEDTILSANSETCASASETALISASMLSRIDFSRFGA